MPAVANKEKRPRTGRSPSPVSSEYDSESDEEGGIRIGGVYVPPPPKALCSSETAGPRLIIHKIVNFNFKSYAGRQVLGPFHKSFTSIIGPNGSGKSNVIDSMLFVFGYRATKIRSKKLSVLIHKSENHQNLRSCTVEVHFHQIQDKEGNDYDIIPNTELVIGRTASADNTSYYTVDGKKSNIKQVAAILGSHGIDLVHNRFLILQGEVEQIAMMKPKALTEHETGMLEYLEDIIGTRRYKKPLRKLEVKVEELSNIRNEKFNKLKLAENEQKALLEPFEDAKEYLKLSNRNAYFSNLLIQRKIHDYKKTLNEFLTQKDELDKKVEELKSEQEKLEQENYHKEKEKKEKKKLIEDKIAQKEKLKDEFNKIENDQTKLNEEIKLTNKKRKKTVEALKTEKEKLVQAEKVPEANNKEIEKLKKREEELKIDLQTKEKEVELILAGIGEKTKKFRDEKDTINNELIGLKNIKDSAKAKHDLAKTELEAYQNNEKKEKAKLEKFKEELETNSVSFKDKTRMYEELKQKLPRAEIDLQIYQKEYMEIKPREKKTTEKLYSLRAQVEEKRASYQANRSRNKVLEFVMDQKQKGVLPGVFGRLGDLGGIDAKYDCAVSTACGPLDYIVTDTVRTAKQCVELLKKHDVGRGNFIALDQQEGLKSQYQRTFKTPENVPRLFDLIKVNDERVKPAFYFGLRDTLVANDLSQAKRCAYGATRYRVVTLGGEIIEIAGTMSGGGREQKRGRMGRSAAVVNESFSANLEAEINEIQQKSSELRNRISYLEEQIDVLSKDTKAWSSQIRCFEIDITSYTRIESDMKKRIKEQTNVVKNAISNPEEVARLTENVIKTKKVYDEASDNSGKLEIKVAALTKKIDELTGGKMKEAQGKLDQVTADLNAVCAKISKCTVGIQTSIRNCKKHERQIEDYTAEIASCESKLEEAQVKLEEFLRIGQLMNEKMTVLKAEIEEDEENMKKIETGRDYLTEINAIKATLMKEKQTVDTLKNKISESKLRIDSQKSQLDKLVVHEIPGEEEEVDGDEEQAGEHVKELREIPPEELESLDLEVIKYQYDQTSEALKQSNANQHLQVVEDFKAMTENVKKRSEELIEASSFRDEVRKGFEELKQARTKEFMTGFIIISSKLKEMYQMITLGGDAEFDLMDTLDPFSEGVVFTVRPPKKSWKRISNLSGGEKTLSSLALVFALHYYKPSPLYVMDEIDAALDFKNVSIVAHYIKERTKNAQFIIISLRSNMFELADLLVGIYKTFNSTKSVTINPGRYTNEENQVSNQPKEDRRVENVPSVSAANESRKSGSQNFVEPNPPTLNSSIDESLDSSRDLFGSSQASRVLPSDSSDEDRHPRKKRRSHDN